MSLSRPARRATGFGLLELMVALGLGLTVVSSATMMWIDQWRALRRQWIESRLTQELRHAAELLTRDLRRAGHWSHAQDGLWVSSMATSAVTPADNPYTALLPALIGPPGAGTVTATSAAYSYDRRTSTLSVQGNERFGWRIHPTTHALELRLSGNQLAAGEGDNWQAVTDVNSVRITQLTFRIGTVELDGTDRCLLACPAGMATCGPRVRGRLLDFELTGQAPSDSTLERRIGGTLKIRSDEVVNQCPRTASP